jgi:hypothetical protein
MGGASRSSISAISFHLTFSGGLIVKGREDEDLIQPAYLVVAFREEEI